MIMEGAFTLRRTWSWRRNGRYAGRMRRMAGYISMSEMDGLNILDFQKYDVLSWLAELMKHRDAADSRRYKMLAQKFIEKYGIDTCGYDVITGWRANASYFYIAKEFVRDNIDIEILEELLSLGGLGIQFCIKSERAFAQLSEVEQDIMSVDYSKFNDRYNSGTTICRAARS